MKRKILFDLTIGSHWPEEPLRPGNAFPIGGTPVMAVIEYETDGVDPLKDACDVLEAEMGDTPYHIWYWYSGHPDMAPKEEEKEK